MSNIIKIPSNSNKPWALSIATHVISSHRSFGCFEWVVLSSPRKSIFASKVDKQTSRMVAAAAAPLTMLGTKAIRIRLSQIGGQNIHIGNDSCKIKYRKITPNKKAHHSHCAKLLVSETKSIKWPMLNHT